MRWFGELLRCSLKDHDTPPLHHYHLLFALHEAYETADTSPLEVRHCIMNCLILFACIVNHMPNKELQFDWLSLQSALEK